jgi:hypothetical protein
MHYDKTEFVTYLYTSSVTDTVICNCDRCLNFTDIKYVGPKPFTVLDICKSHYSVLKIRRAIYW